MATLEKIRSKSVLLFTIIIVALLAFILGDFLTSGRSLFGGGTTIAQIGDHKIDVQLFQHHMLHNRSLFSQYTYYILYPFYIKNIKLTIDFSEVK